LEEPRGIIEVEGRQIPVRAIFTRSERLKDAVDRAYAEKFNTPGSANYVKGFAEKKRRDTTTELVPEGRIRKAEVRGQGSKVGSQRSEGRKR
jgi:hypothetical protein